MQPLILVATIGAVLALVSSYPSHGKWSSSYGWGVSHPTYASGYSKWSPSYDYGSKVWPSSAAVWPVASSYSHSKYYPSYKKYPSYSSGYYPSSHEDYSSSYVPSYSSYSHGLPSSYSSGYSHVYPSSYSHGSSWPSSYSGHSSAWDWD